MQLLKASHLVFDTAHPERIKRIVESTLRLITFSRAHLADDLLNAYINKTSSFKELLSIKNAQLEAQSEDEIAAYALLLDEALLFITNEIEKNVGFYSEKQLFQLFRIISPDAHSLHPNRYRDKLVQIGRYICPEPHRVPGLVDELFFQMKQIAHPVIRAIYFHHELIRIHPFADGNGRTVRMAKNWMLMYELYAPIFISTGPEKLQYIRTLEASFTALEKNPNESNPHLEAFIDQELTRLEKHCVSVHKAVALIGQRRVD